MSPLAVGLQIADGLPPFSSVALVSASSLRLSRTCSKHARNGDMPPVYGSNKSGMRNGTISAGVCNCRRRLRTVR